MRSAFESVTLLLATFEHEFNNMSSKRLLLLLSVTFASSFTFGGAALAALSAWLVLSFGGALLADETRPEVDGRSSVFEALDEADI